MPVILGYKVKPLPDMCVTIFFVLISVHFINTDLAGSSLRVVCVQKLANRVIIVTMACAFQRIQIRLLTFPIAQRAAKWVLSTSAFRGIARQDYRQRDEQRHDCRHCQPQLEGSGNRRMINARDIRQQQRPRFWRVWPRVIFITRTGSIYRNISIK